MNLQTIEAYLRSLADGNDDPRKGLPDEIFNFLLAVTPMINVDLLVRDEGGRTLLAWREDQWGSGWHMPGGIVRWQESLEVRIAEVAKWELGITVTPEVSPCCMTQFREGHRGHFISLLYICRLRDPYLEQPVVIESDACPRQGSLSWSSGIPDMLYPAHKVYVDFLSGHEPSQLVQRTVFRNEVV